MRDRRNDFDREWRETNRAIKTGAVLSTIAGLLVVVLFCWTAIQIAEILAGC
jgi:hypothetical protein